MKKLYILLMFVMSAIYSMAGIRGDLDNNAIIDVEDVNAAINIILKINSINDYPGNGDIDDNGFIDVEDVNHIINFILQLESPVDEWVLLCQGVDLQTIEIPMSGVGCLVAVDDALDFSVLSSYGDVLADSILKVTFGQRWSALVTPVNAGDNKIRRVVKDHLTFIGLSGEICIYDAYGTLIKRAESTGGEAVVKVNNLQSGTYFLKSGNQVFKFVKSK